MEVTTSLLCPTGLACACRRLVLVLVRAVPVDDMASIEIVF